MNNIKCVYFEKNTTNYAIKKMLERYIKMNPSFNYILLNNNFHFGYILNEYVPENNYPYEVLGFMIVYSIFQQGEHVNFHILCGIDESNQDSQQRHFDLLYKKTNEHIQNNVPFKNYTIFLSVPHKNCIDLLMDGHEIIQELPEKMFLMRKNFN